MDELILAESYNATSQRHAVLACDKDSAWLYLHQPTDQPEKLNGVESSSCAFNRVPPIRRTAVKKYQPSPPPIVDGFASTQAVCENPSKDDWGLRWSIDGQSVVVYRGRNPWCFLTPDNRQGYSRAIAVDGPWGKSWSDEAFAKVQWNSSESDE